MRGLQNVRLRDAKLRQVRRGTEVKPVGLVEERGEDLGREQRSRSQNLETVSAFLRDPLRELAGLLGRVDRSLIPTPLAREDVRKDPRRDDLILRAAVSLVQA